MPELILVIDDDTTLLGLLAEHLDNAGYRAVTAASGCAKSRRRPSSCLPPKAKNATACAAYAEATTEIIASGPPLQHQPGALSAPSAPRVLALALLVVLGGVWATFGFVGYQVLRIRRG